MDVPLTVCSALFLFDVKEKLNKKLILQTRAQE